MATHVITDIHNCFEEFIELIEKLGFVTTKKGMIIGHPRGDTLIIGGDFIDRGPYPINTLDCILDAFERGTAIVVKGGHEDEMEKILTRYPYGDWDTSNHHHSRKVTLDALSIMSNEYRAKVASTLAKMPASFNHWGESPSSPTVVHAAWSQARNKKMMLHGSTTGWSVDEKWKSRIPEHMTVVSGHRNMKEVKLVENKHGGVSWAIDTGCCFGNKLTALTYNRVSEEITSVQAKHTYYPIPSDHWWT